MKHQSGVTVVEYALLLFLIAITCIVGLTLVGNASKNRLTLPSTTTTTACVPNGNGHGNNCHA